MTTWTASDYYFMNYAITLAKRGKLTTPPNPCVGCVIVKSNRVISSGWHRAPGEAHAEINALTNTKLTLNESKCYVTLEPCCHHGKTGPCTEALIQSGIKHVIIAMLDPNPLVNGKGAAMLDSSGIKVDIGLLSNESAKLNPIFIRNMHAN